MRSRAEESRRRRSCDGTVPRDLPTYGICSGASTTALRYAWSSLFFLTFILSFFPPQWLLYSYYYWLYQIHVMSYHVLFPLPFPSQLQVTHRIYSSTVIKHSLPSPFSALHNTQHPLSPSYAHLPRLKGFKIVIVHPPF